MAELVKTLLKQKGIGETQLFDVPQILTNGTGDPMRSTMTLIMYLNKHLFRLTHHHSCG